MPHPPHTLNSVHVTRGETKVLNITVKTGEGRVFSLDGTTMYLSIKKRASDSAALVQKSSDDGGGIVLTKPTEGIAEATLSTEDTLSLPAPQQLLYDVWVEKPGVDGASPERYPVVRSAQLFVEPGITSFS